MRWRIRNLNKSKGHSGAIVFQQPSIELPAQRLNGFARLGFHIHSCVIVHLQHDASLKIDQPCQNMRFRRDGHFISGRSAHQSFAHGRSGQIDSAPIERRLIFIFRSQGRRPRTPWRRRAEPSGLSMLSGSSGSRPAAWQVASGKYRGQRQQSCKQLIRDGLRATKGLNETRRGLIDIARQLTPNRKRMR